ncbi:proline iminopeptidase [Arabidopsis thaliana]|uniref:Proline iminopeptidase n=1 Tax=Arabidopsis thaliana TaxID=3702 RepID=A0A1P8B2D9_ARATH|nr:proline iminopeptidase [Arabidopsis thaliana]ANM63063.1 proline iminopeptidase [Arabidopsis thaliana]|eukprot:NP_001325176.1 proline iminopeptidase [Arabidopsis thaliana]
MNLILASFSLAPCFCVRFFPSNHNNLNLLFPGQRKIQVSCGGKSEVLKSDTMEPHEAETFVNKRTLYAPIEPYSSGNLKVSDVHTLYWEQSGKPDGHPVVFLHGGPGGGTAPSNRRFFDPEFYRIVLFDQRGAGKSTPHACLEENTTWDLVNDIEKLREHLKIPEWLVFGGSWGSTLALAYSQSHPDKVTGLVLRGIFLLRKKEIDWFYEGGAAAIYPDAWEEFRDLIPENERGSSLVDAYHKRLNSDDLEIQYAAARAWTKWEMMTAYLRPNLENVQKAEDDKFSLAFARIENHYFVNKGFFPSDSHLLDNVDKIRHIKTTIVQTIGYRNGNTCNKKKTSALGFSRCKHNIDLAIYITFIYYGIEIGSGLLKWTGKV